MRKQRACFDGTTDFHEPPPFLDGESVFDQIKIIRDVQFGKQTSLRKRKRLDYELNWTKKSIFFSLPYWKSIKLRHCLDVMHIKKNICDNLIGTLLSVPGKTKDTT